MMMGSTICQDPEQLKYYEHPIMVNNNVNMMQDSGMPYHQMQGSNHHSSTQFTQMQNMTNVNKFRDFFE